MLFAGIAGAIVCGSISVSRAEAAGAIPAPPCELSSLENQVAALRTALTSRDAAIRQLEARNAELKLDLSAFRGAVALASNGAPARREATESPSSSLGWASALRAATAAKLMVNGSELLTVMPTGSMEPMFNERAILLMEPARFEDLKIGDVVTYKNPRFGLLVVHRILERHGDKFWSKGDGNGRMDRVYITRENYGARVFGIIYAHESSAQARLFSQSLVDR
jgi:signal peptidase